MAGSPGMDIYICAVHFAPVYHTAAAVRRNTQNTTRSMPQQWITRSISTAVVFPPDKTALPAMVPTKKDQANRALGLVAGAEKRMGPRPDQQDYFETCATVSEDVFGGDLELCAFGVFDGHGGDGVAKYLAKHMCSKLVTATRSAALNDPRSLQASIEQVYTEIDAVVCGLPFARNAGSCAVTAQLMGDALVVANAGDCEAWLCRNGEPVELTVPHKAENPAEQKRIAAAGGVIYGRNQRLASVLAVTRNFGAFNVKSMNDARGLTALPHVSVVPLRPEDEFMILGSDGLFDRFPNRQNLMNFAKQQLRKTRSAAATAKAITDHVLDERNGTDNTTVQVVVFNQMGVVSAQANAYGVGAGFAQATGKCARAVRVRSRSIARDMMDAVAAADLGSAGASAAAGAGTAGGAGQLAASPRPAAPSLAPVPDADSDDESSEEAVAASTAADREGAEPGGHDGMPPSASAAAVALPIPADSQPDGYRQMDRTSSAGDEDGFIVAAVAGGGAADEGSSKEASKPAGSTVSAGTSAAEEAETVQERHESADGPSSDLAQHHADFSGEPAVDVSAA